MRLKILHSVMINHLNFGDGLGSFNKDDKSDSKKTMKTPVLDKFCKNISEQAEEGNLDPVVGRKVELKRGYHKF